jgi:DNA repair protein RadD
MTALILQFHGRGHLKAHAEVLKRGVVLRPYQDRIIGQWYSASEHHRRILVMAATGAGTTEIAIAMINGALATGKRAIFVAPALSLIDQTVDFLSRGLRDVGVMQANHPRTNPASGVQVCSEQTLRRRDVPDARLVIIDECHRQSTFINDWLVDPDWEDTPFVGLSATPWARGMGRRWDHLIVGATTRELIDQGYFSRFRVFAPDSADLRGVRVRAGDYVESDLSTVMNRTELVGDVVCTRRAHALNLQQQFEQAGVPAGYIDCFTKRERRQEIADALHAGRYKVVVNVGCLTIGIDWDIRCIILARPTKSEMLFVQMIGRDLRTALGKIDCLILDHSDTHLRLGFVTDIVYDTLNRGEPKTAESARESQHAPKRCPECKFLMSGELLQCPECGHVLAEPQTKHRDERQLIEIHGLDCINNVDFYRQLLHLQDARAYRPGWAAHQYRARLGHFPPWAWNDLA